MTNVADQSDQAREKDEESRAIERELHGDSYVQDLRRVGIHRNMGALFEEWNFVAALCRAFANSPTEPLAKELIDELQEVIGDHDNRVREWIDEHGPAILNAHRPTAAPRVDGPGEKHHDDFEEDCAREWHVGDWRIDYFSDGFMGWEAPDGSWWTIAHGKRRYMTAERRNLTLRGKEIMPPIEWQDWPTE